MLRILGSARRLCNGWTRRDMLRAGGLGLMGLELGDLLRADQPRAAEAEKELQERGRAKACILLYLYGAPSQLETFDPKPDAPAEIRGTFGFPSSGIGTNLPFRTMPQCCSRRVSESKRGFSVSRVAAALYTLAQAR